MIKELVRLADHLDKKGLLKEADYLDKVIKKYSQNKRNHTFVNHRDGNTTVLECVAIPISDSALAEAVDGGDFHIFDRTSYESLDDEAKGKFEHYYYDRNMQNISVMVPKQEGGDCYQK